MASSASVPSIEELAREADALLGTYQPSALSYLDGRGEWRKVPRTLPDRVSCELWFMLWEARNTGALTSRCEELFFPLVTDESAWRLVLLLIQETTEATPGSARPRLLAAALAFGVLVEADAYESLATRWSAEWDRRARYAKALYAERLDDLVGKLRKTLSSAEDLERFLALRPALRAVPDSIFDSVSRTISEEEWVRLELDGLMAELRSGVNTEEACELISARVCPHPSIAGKEPRALLRPCVELLASEEVDVSTGIQYRASGFLGRLADVRSTEALMDAFDRSAPCHSFLRTNLVYALGNLREKKALPLFVKILNEPDRVAVPCEGGSYMLPLDTEKREAVWALGKLGAEATAALPSLTRYASSPDRETRLYLAWAMGTIGAGQKLASGGIDVTIPIALMNILTGKDPLAFEEATFALRLLGLPDFLHTLYLHDFKTVPLLSLKPSNTGLYELSETLLHLASVKRPVVMAVTGDSGTGKTYFCRTIAGGFGGIEAHDILYLMRDAPENRVFDRILGIKWLKAHNDARFYENYPVSEEQDEPEEFFDEFLIQNADKKLIILDGWRDEPYFHQVVRKFYEKGHLDVLVRFQTSFSTRRINLEQREGTLDRVAMHLPLIETPAMEETRFYQEGAVLIYHLDNSIPSRLSASEIREVFDRQKIETWGDQIRVGRFARNTRPLSVRRQELDHHRERVSEGTEHVPGPEPLSFSPAEESFLRVLNEDVGADPNLLQLVRLRKAEVDRIAFYNHGQLAFCGGDGSVGVLTGYNDRVYDTKVHQTSATGIAVVGGDVCSVDSEGNLAITSFRRNTVASLPRRLAPALTLAPFGESSLVTGHADGSVAVWDLSSGSARVLIGHGAPVTAASADRRGRVYSGSEDGEVRVWALSSGDAEVLRADGHPVRALDAYVDGRVAVACGRTGRTILILDPESGECDALDLECGVVRCLSVYFDGRIIVGLDVGRVEAGPGATAGREPEAAVGGSDGSRGSLVVVDPRPDFLCYNTLSGHGAQTRDCVSMGPRIVTCGVETSGERTLRIWGTATYVAKELGKLRLMPETMGKPPYYRALF